MTTKSLLSRLERKARAVLPPAGFPQYASDPQGYISDILKITLTAGQQEAVEALMQPPYRVLCGSGHSVGKSVLGACLVNWWFDTHSPGLCLTTAPTDRQVKDILWKEVRRLRSRAKLPDYWVGPKIPRLESGPTHFAHGFTARDSTRFQGHHSPGGVLIIFDESEGVEAEFWEALKTMLDDQSHFIAFYNPTTPGSACHLAELEAEEHHTYRRVNISCVDHPNIKNQLQGLPPAIPGAISLTQLKSMLIEDSTILTNDDEKQVGDVELDGVWYRPGPVAEARCLGRRPTSATSGVWSEQLWKRMIATRLIIDPSWPIAIGCDVARYGDDSTVIFVRKGLVLLHVESHVKVNTSTTARRLRELACQFADSSNDRFRIPILIDEGGIGGGVIDQREDYLFLPVNAACSPRNKARYYNTRSELWFSAREPLSNGPGLDVSRIPVAYLNRLKVELLSAQYRVEPKTDKIRVLSKDDMKVLLGRSPDLADAFNLCLYPPPVIHI